MLKTSTLCLRSPRRTPPKFESCCLIEILPSAIKVSPRPAFQSVGKRFHTITSRQKKSITSPMVRESWRSKARRRMLAWAMPSRYLPAKSIKLKMTATSYCDYSVAVAHRTKTMTPSWLNRNVIEIAVNWSFQFNFEHIFYNKNSFSFRFGREYILRISGECVHSLIFLTVSSFILSRTECYRIDRRVPSCVAV